MDIDLMKTLLKGMSAELDPEQQKLAKDSQDVLVGFVTYMLDKAENDKDKAAIVIGITGASLVISEKIESLT